MQTTIWMMAAAMAVFCSGSVTAGPVQDLPVQTETENGGDGDAVLEGSLQRIRSRKASYPKTVESCLRYRKERYSRKR